jgi:hypothetical protein
MPRGPFLSAKDEYRGSLCLIPAGSDGGTVVYFEISQQLNVGHDREVQILSGRIGDVRSRIEGGELPFVELKGKDLELFMFDPLRIQLEEYPPDNLRGVSSSHLANFNRRSNSVNDYHRYRIDPLHITLESFLDDTLPGTGQANFNRRSTCCGNYQRLSATTEYFSRITLQSAAEPLCHKPLLASVFFPNRELIDDRGVACIVMESWRHQSLINLIILDREKTDRLVWRALLTIREFMEAGWELHRLEENLYINLNNQDIFIDPIALSDATPIGPGKVQPEYLKREIEFAVKRMRPRGTSPKLDRMITHLLEAKVSAPQILSPGRRELMLSRLL